MEKGCGDRPTVAPFLSWKAAGDESTDRGGIATTITTEHTHPPQWQPQLVKQTITVLVTPWFISNQPQAVESHTEYWTECSNKLIIQTKLNLDCTEEGNNSVLIRPITWIVINQQSQHSRHHTTRLFVYHQTIVLILLPLAYYFMLFMLYLPYYSFSVWLLARLSDWKGSKYYTSPSESPLYCSRHVSIKAASCSN